MTVHQFDQLQHLARRLDVATLAVRALGTDARHHAVEDVLGEIHDDLRAFTEGAA
jgi:hypothetical protein